jgi:competence protein ComEC
MPRAGWLALGALGGALLAAIAPSAGVGLAGAVAALVFAGLARRRKSPRSRRIAIAAIGAAIVLLRAAAGSAITPSDQSPPASLPGASHQASVLSVGTASGGQQRVVLELAPPEPTERVYAWLPRYPALATFDRLQFEGKLEPAIEGDGFGDFLARSGIAFTARIREFELIGSADTPFAELEHVRRTGADLLARSVPQPQAGLAAGLLIGLRDLVARDVSTDFRIAGLSHIVAISGSHLALIAALAISLLRRLGRRPRSLIVLALIWAYALLAGASPSVIRAAVMATVVVGARESGRAGQAQGALAVTAAVMLLVDPRVVTDAGFQLSLAATAGLLAWAGPLTAWLRSRLPRQVPAIIVEGLAMSLAAQVATEPLVLLEFGQLSIVAPLANLLAAPLVAPAMLSSAAALAASAAVSAGLPAIAIAPFTVGAAVSVGALIAVAHICASLPLASLTLAPPLNIVGAGIALVALVVFARGCGRVEAADLTQSLIEARRQTEGEQLRPRRRRLAWAAGAAGIALLLSAMVASARPDGRLHMTVLDVGQGDSILLEGPSGGRILVDTGPDPDRLLTLLDARLPAWDRRLDVVVITHPHEDHVAGLALLLDRYRIGEIAEPGMIGLGPGDAAFRRRLAELGRQTRLLAAGDRLSLDGIELDVLWPQPGGVPLHPKDGGTDVNNVSIVLAMQFGEKRFLLGGDIEQQIDPQLLAHGPLSADPRPFDVLKVAHHGSGTATTDAFLDRVKPHIAIVSAGWGNPYGHPSPRTVERLEASGAQVFRTDLDGSVTITSDGHDLLAQASGGRPIPSRPVAFLAPGLGWCPIPQVAYAAAVPP